MDEKIKTAELTGEQLDYWVGKAMGREMRIQSGEAEILYRRGEVRNTNPIWSGFDPSANWSKGGLIIEREEICVEPHAHFVEENDDRNWRAIIYYNAGEMHAVSGPTPLTAAMRAFVASKFGDTVPGEENA